jgi:integrase
MGSVFKVNPRCRFWYVKYKGADGRMYCESSRCERKEDAKKILRAKESKIDQGVPITPAVGKVTLDEAVEDLSAFYRKKGRAASLKGAERRARLHLAPFFGGKRRLATISSADIDAYVAKRQADSIRTKAARTTITEDGTELVEPEKRKPVSSAQINRELQLLRRLFTLAIRNGRLMTRPSIELLAEAPPRSGFFERDQIDALCAHLPAEVQPIVRFMFITGWRLSEVLGLEWNRVDFTGRGHVRLASGTTKNGEARLFPMTIELRQLMEARQAAKAAAELETEQIIPWVFFRLIAEGRGGPLKAHAVKTFTKAWKSACAKAGCPGRIPHDLRRSAIRTFVRRGLGEHTAMALSGHKTSSVFRRYDIVSADDLEDAAAKLDAAPQPAPSEDRSAVVRKFAAR